MTTGTGPANLGEARGRVILDTTGVVEGMRRAHDATQSGFAAIGSTIQGVGASVTRVGALMTGLTAPITALGVIGVREFGRFDDALAEIEARTGATAGEMDAVRSMAIKMGQDTAYSSTQAAQAMLQLLSSGYTLKETFAALPAVLSAAAASGLDLGYVADSVTDILAMFNLGAEEATRVADALARGAAASSAEIGDLTQGFGNVGPMARSMGLSIEETTAILAAFSERGIKGAEAGTQLRSMLTHMTSDVASVQGVWKELNISMFDAAGNMRPLGDVMEDLRRKMADMTQQERIRVIKELGGSYGQLGLEVLTSSPAMENMLDLMNQQTGAAEVAEKRLKSWNGTVKQLKSSISTGLIVALQGLLDGLKPTIQAVTSLLNRLTAWMIANPQLTNQIVRVLALLAAFGPGLMVVGKAISLVGGLIAAVNTPLLLVGAGVAALYMAWEKNLGGIQSVTKKTLKPVLKTVQYIAYWIGKAFSANAEEGGVFAGLIGAWNALFYVFQDGETTFFSKFFEAMGVGADLAQQWGLKIVQAKDWINGALLQVISFIQSRVLPVLVMVGNWIVGQFVPAVINLLVNHALPLIREMFDFFAQAWEIVAPALGKIYDWFVVTALPAILSFIVDVLIPALGLWMDTLRVIWETVGPVLLKVLEWFVTTGGPAIIKAIKEDIIPAVESVTEAMKKTWDDSKGNLESLRDFWVEDMKPAMRDAAIDITVAAGKIAQEMVRIEYDTRMARGALKLWWVQDGAPAIVKFINNDLLPATRNAADGFRNIWEKGKGALGSLYNYWWTREGPLIKDKISSLIYELGLLEQGMRLIWDNSKPFLEAMYNWLTGTFSKIAEEVFGKINIKMSDVVKTALDLYNGLVKLGDGLPGWLTPGSPTPFETGLRGIDAAMRSLVANPLPTMMDRLAPTAAGGTHTEVGGDTYHIAVTLTPAQAKDENIGYEVADKIKAALAGQRLKNGRGVTRG